MGDPACGHWPHRCGREHTSLCWATLTPAPVRGELCCQVLSLSGDKDHMPQLAPMQFCLEALRPVLLAQSRK